MFYSTLELIKKRLKEIDWTYQLNAQYKSARLKREYELTKDHYAKKLPVEFLILLKNRIASRLIKEDRPRIFFLGTDELQDRGGIIQALEQTGDLTYFTRSDGSYGQNHPGPDIVRQKTNTERLLYLFSQLHAQNRTPQILIAQTWASFVDPTALSHIREEYGTIIVNIAMDDRHQYWGGKINGQYGGTYSLIPHIDLALTAAPECVDWYLKEGCPALFFPEASDPAIYHPMPELSKIHDVSFVGGRYGIREQIVIALQKAGIRVTTYGSGWGTGRISTEEVPKLFAQSKIILGIGTIGHCQDFYSLKMRDFDGPMSGSCYCTHDNADLHTLYEIGKEIVTYRSVPDCVDKVKYLLNHDSVREQVAAAGYQRALKDHTWKIRFKTLVNVLNAEGAT